MSRIALFVVALVAMIALASAFGFHYQVNSYFEDETETLTEKDVCEQVGVISGCSGCVHGTKGLCTWVQIPDSASGKRGFVDFVHFECIPRKSLHLLEETLGVTDINASHSCPADPTKEPIIRVTASDDFVDRFKLTSTIFSTYHDSNLVNFPTKPWAVDRTSFYGLLGAGYLQRGNDLEYTINCTSLTSPDLVIVQKNSEGESDLFNGELESGRDKYCVRLALAGFASSRCIGYGVAVSGICQSFYDQIQQNCGSGHDDLNAGPNTGYAGASLAFEAYFVVPDQTLFCLKSFPLYPSGVFEEAAGFYDDEVAVYDPPPAK
jgi:hypothetical protein